MDVDQIVRAKALIEDRRLALTEGEREQLRSLLRAATRACREEALEQALEEVVGCFEAAFAEGLAGRLNEADGEAGLLRDLVERRVLPAYNVAVAARIPLADGLFLVTPPVSRVARAPSDPWDRPRSPAYVCSGPHLSGWRVEVGFVRREDARDFHQRVAQTGAPPPAAKGGDAAYQTSPSSYLAQYGQALGDPSPGAADGADLLIARCAERARQARAQGMGGVGLPWPDFDALLALASVASLTAKGENDEMEHHAIERTSPKGGPYVGRCINCGRENLSSRDFFTDECPNPSGRSRADTLAAAIEGDAP